MNVKLTNDDRCAIDLVLEGRSQGNGAVDSCFGKVGASLQKRVRAVEAVLSTLGQMPAEEPPANLVAKTMKFIKKHEHDVVKAPAAHRPAAIHGINHRHLH